MLTNEEERAWPSRLGRCQAESVIRDERSVRTSVRYWNRKAKEVHGVVENHVPNVHPNGETVAESVAVQICIKASTLSIICQPDNGRYQANARVTTAHDFNNMSNEIQIFHIPLSNYF